MPRLPALGNVDALPADLTCMMLRLSVFSFSFAFIVTAAAGPVVAVVACVGLLIVIRVEARRHAARRGEAADADAVEARAEEAEVAARVAADAVVAEAEAVIAAARVRMLGGATS